MNLRTLSLSLLAVFFLSLGLGTYFNNQCGAKACLRTVAENQKNGNFHISFDDDDQHDSDRDPDPDFEFGTRDEPRDLLPPKVDGLDSLDIEVVRTDIEIRPGQALKLKVEGVSNDKGWNISTSGKTLKIDMKVKGPERLYLEVPKEFNGAVNLTTVSGDLLLGEKLGFKKLSIQTASGDSLLKSMPSDELVVQTVSGDFASQTSAPATKEIRVNGVSADLALEVPTGFNKLKIQTVSGNAAIRIQGKANFDYRMHSISGDFEGIPNGSMQGGIANKEMQGTVGEKGKSQLEFESISGDFKLTL